MFLVNLIHFIDKTECSLRRKTICWGLKLHLLPRKSPFLILLTYRLPQTTFFLEEGATTEDKSLPHDSIMVPFWLLKTTSEQQSDLVLKLCFHWEDATYKIHRFSPFLPVQIKQMVLLHTLVRTNVTAVLLLDGPSLPYLKISFKHDLCSAEEVLRSPALLVQWFLSQKFNNSVGTEDSSSLNYMRASNRLQQSAGL